MRRKVLLLKRSGNNWAQEVRWTFVKALHFSGERKACMQNFCAFTKIMLSVTTLSVVMPSVTTVSIANALAFFHRKRQFQSKEVLRFLCKKLVEEGSTFVSVL
jgi:hypothetical protein